MGLLQQSFGNGPRRRQVTGHAEKIHHRPFAVGQAGHYARGLQRPAGQNHRRDHQHGPHHRRPADDQAHPWPGRVPGPDEPSGTPGRPTGGKIHPQACGGKTSGTPRRSAEVPAGLRRPRGRSRLRRAQTRRGCPAGESALSHRRRRQSQKRGRHLDQGRSGQSRRIPRLAQQTR